MHFQDYLRISASEVEEELQKIFDNWRAEIREVNPKVLKLLETSIQASKGGKRLRGALVKLGYELASSVILIQSEVEGEGSLANASTTGTSPEILQHDSASFAHSVQNDREKAQNNKHILRPAAAYEVFQTAILAHDDVIDKSPLRRGVPTIYQSLGANHYAVSQTICLGDIGFFLAFQIIADSEFSDEEKTLAVKAFSKTLIDTAFGEMLDIELSHLKNVQDEEDVLSIARYKSAWYTFVGPLQLGAALGGGDERLLSHLKVFGEKLGIAFQIHDDILGIFGSEETLGKSVTSDISEGKNTLLITYALKKANEQQRKKLHALYGKGTVNREEGEEIRKTFKETGALDYARQIELEYVNSAKEEIKKITGDMQMITFLEEMADYLVKRDR